VCDTSPKDINAPKEKEALCSVYQRKEVSAAMLANSEYDEREDDVILDNIGVWRPCHGWSDGETTWVDAYLFTPDSGKLKGNIFLDIGCAGDDCCVKEEEATLAGILWETGKVHYVKPFTGTQHVDALILPHANLSTALIYEALERFERMVEHGEMIPPVAFDRLSEEELLEAE
jgi:hypothetical protein